jgi:Xaa-Pro aminopeptidase
MNSSSELLEKDYLSKRISVREYQERADRVRRAMASEGLDVGIAYATEHMPGDVQYLTGYDPHLENVALLVTPERIVALGGAEGEKMFEDVASFGEWRNLSLFEIPFQDYGSTKFWSLPEILVDVLGHIPREIGILSARNVISAEMVDLVGQTGTGTKTRDAAHILAKARYEKSPAELDMFRIASGIATAAMRTLLDRLQPGLRELELAAEADRVMKQMGAYNYGFDAMVCSGPRINTIIGRSSNRVIQDGEVVMLGVSPRYEGYTSAIGRTVVAGTASPEQREFLDRGIEAYNLASKAFKAGQPAKAVDAAARNYLTKVGLGRYHTYGVGHGIGLTECLEGKTATSASDYDLPAGIAMMLDVGLFGVPEHFGARHENPHMVDHEGQSKVLTDLPMKVYA